MIVPTAEQIAAYEADNTPERKAEKMAAAEQALRDRVAAMREEAPAAEAEKPAKPAHAAHVSRMLQDAGCEKSTSARSMVRGLPNVYRGFVAKQAGTSVVITHETGGYVRNASAEGQDEKRRRLARYADILRGHGFMLDVEEHRVVVSGRMA